MMQFASNVADAPNYLVVLLLKPHGPTKACTRVLKTGYWS